MTAMPRFQLHDPELLRTLMKRTGDGSSITIRELSDAAGVNGSYVGELLTGVQQSARFDVAVAIAERIGVDLLVLWVPAGRTVRAQKTPRQAVSA